MLTTDDESNTTNFVYFSCYAQKHLIGKDVHRLSQWLPKEVNKSLGYVINQWGVPRPEEPLIAVEIRVHRT